MARGKSIEVEKKWRARLEALEASGLTARAFAIREGLNVGGLCAWRRKLRGDVATPATSFTPVVVRDEAPRRRDGFELVIADGLALRIPSDFDEATLSRIVRALGAAR
jgi:hypothetical protein